MKSKIFLLAFICTFSLIKLIAQIQTPNPKSPKIQSISISPKLAIPPKTLSNPQYNFPFQDVRWLGDINKDGKTEMAICIETADDRTTKPEDKVWKTAFFNDLYSSEPNEVLYDKNLFPIGDFNKDSIDDLFDLVSGSVFIGSKTGLNPNGAQISNMNYTSINIIPIKDINGDGYADFFSFDYDSCQFVLGNDVTFQDFISLTDFTMGLMKVYPFDFDKDGKAELFCIPNYDNTIKSYFVKYINNQMKIIDSIDFSENYDSYYSGFCDLNGDKFPDFFYPVLDSVTGLNDLEIRFGKATTPYFGTKQIIKTQSKLDNFVYYGDVNKDGFDDIVGSDKNGTPTIFFGSANVQNGFKPQFLLAPAFIISSPTNQYITGDDDGDGYPDMIYNYYRIDTITGQRLSLGFGILRGGQQISEMNNRNIFQNYEDAGNRLGYGMSTVNLGDVNGDGNEDFAISAFYGMYADIFFGKKNLSSKNDCKIILDQRVQVFLYSIEGGDINGDSISDIILSKTGADSSLNNILIYFGRKEWKTTLYEKDADIILKAPSKMDYFGYFIKEIGDFNDDGYNDFVVSGTDYQLNDTTFKSEAYLYPGGKTISQTPLKINGGTSKVNSYFGYRISKLGDINSDGYADFAISDRNSNNSDGTKGRVLVFFGGKEINLNNYFEIPCPYYNVNLSSINRFGSFMALSPGDYDGDGINDIVIGSSRDSKINAGRIFIYKGGTNLKNTYNYTVDLYDIKNILDTSTAYGVYSAVDFAYQFSKENNYDLIVSTGIGSSTNAYVYKCGSPGNKTQADFMLKAPNSEINLGGHYKFAVGNFNNDKKLDIVMGQIDDYNYGIQAGIAYLFESPNAVITEVKEEETIETKIISGIQNYPNPFGSSITIKFYLEKECNTEISVFDIFGNKVSDLDLNYIIPGWNEVSWDGTAQNGKPMPSGEYLLKFKAGQEVLVRKMLLIR